MPSLTATLTAALLLGAVSSASIVAAAEPELLALAGNLDVHDPVIIKEGGTYYLYATGGRPGRGSISAFTSPDMRQWTRAGFALARLPEWVASEVPRATNAWAPDISFYNGKFHLYYSLSSFGVNESAIGLATNKTLDPASPDFKWVDEGLVVRSRTGQDDFNAIDPNLVIEDEKNVWLTWGSFWGGVMLRRIDPATGKLSESDTTLHKPASRSRSKPHETPPVEGAIEAPFIIRHDEHWYLFASWDFCCPGPRRPVSDYKVVVGRAEKVTGPYLDREGQPMSEGGGTLVLEAATETWRGAGHPAIYQEGGTDYMLFHAYPTAGRGSRLHISTIVWEDGWPRVARMP
ncbi:MAG: family 43 glycosylhydrolase [Pirellulales bacterium]